MNLDMSGKAALVTGSTAGIGIAIAAGLAEQGAHVWINGRTQARVDSAIATIMKKNPKAKLSGVAADVATAEGGRTVAAAIAEVDILVNNMGTVNVRKPFEELTDADWTELFEINVMSGVRMTRQYIGAMRRKNWGRVIFISSESGVQIPTEFIHYGMTKAANIAVARGVAETLVKSGVTVNSVLPGPTMAQGATKRLAESGKNEAEFNEEFFKTVRPTSLQQRFHRTEEVANMVVYLCSPAASGTHGAALRVEGGLLKSAF